MGKIRWEHAGEGEYDEMENKLRELLKEAGMESASNLTNNRLSAKLDR